MFISFVRTIILYFMIILAVRVMGKRQINQLQTSELVVTLLISDLAAIPMQDSGQPLFSGLIPILVLIALEVLVSVFMLKSSRFHRLVCGKPVVIIKDGRIIQENMQELRMSVEDLFEQLRQKDIFVLAAVDYLRPSDMGVKVKDEGLEVVVVSDGDLSVGSMHLCGKNEEWIHSILKSEAVPLSEVFILTVNTAGHYTLIRRDGSLKKGVKK